MTTARRSLDQNKRYWALIQKLPTLAADEENRRAVTMRVTSHVSTADLSVSEMNGLCQYLEYLAGERRLADVEFPHVVSVAQKNELRRLEHDLGWHANPARLAGFLLRQTKGRTDQVDELTRAEAAKVINGLKFILRRSLLVANVNSPGTPSEEGLPRNPS